MHGIRHASPTGSVLTGHRESALKVQAARRRTRPATRVCSIDSLPRRPSIQSSGSASTDRASHVSTHSVNVSQNETDAANQRDPNQSKRLLTTLSAADAPAPFTAAIPGTAEPTASNCLPAAPGTFWAIPTIQIDTYAEVFPRVKKTVTYVTSNLTLRGTNVTNRKSQNG